MLSTLRLYACAERERNDYTTSVSRFSQPTSLITWLGARTPTILEQEHIPVLATPCEHGITMHIVFRYEREVYRPVWYHAHFDVLLQQGPHCAEV